MIRRCTTSIIQTPTEKLRFTLSLTKNNFQNHPFSFNSKSRMSLKLSKKQQNLILQEQSESQLDSTNSSNYSKDPSLKIKGKGFLHDDSTSLSDLNPKPCITCGREITPRSKWLRNWDTISTCSDGCKAQKPGSRNTLIREKRKFKREELENFKVELNRIGVGECLKFILVEKTGNEKEAEDDVEDDQEVVMELDLERWIEDLLLRMVQGSLSNEKLNSEIETKNGSSNGKHFSSKSSSNLISCSQIELQLTHQLQSLQEINVTDSNFLPSTSNSIQIQHVDVTSSRSHRKKSEEQDVDHSSDISSTPPTLSKSDQKEINSSDHPFSKALNSNPGLRERVRRASRRLMIFDKDSIWSLNPKSTSREDPPSARTDTSVHKILLEKKLALINDGRKLESLGDVSFAKGEIFLDLVDR